MAWHAAARGYDEPVPSLLRLLVRRGRAAPWLMVLEGGRWLASHGHQGWQDLTPAEQGDLQRFLRVSKGRPGRLTANERTEMSRIVRKGALAAIRRR